MRAPSVSVISGYRSRLSGGVNRSRAKNQNRRTDRDFVAVSKRGSTLHTLTAQERPVLAREILEARLTVLHHDPRVRSRYPLKIDRNPRGLGPADEVFARSEGQAAFTPYKMNGRSRR